MKKLVKLFFLTYTLFTTANSWISKKNDKDRVSTPTKSVCRDNEDRKKERKKKRKQTNSVFSLTSNVELNNQNLIVQPNSRVTINGNGHSVKCTSSREPGMYIPQNCTVILENIDIENMNPSNFSIDQSSRLVFGENCKVSLSDDIVLDQNSWTWIFDKTAFILGNNNALIITEPNKLNIRENSNLNLQVLNLITRTEQPWNMLNSSTIKLKNSQIIIEKNNLTYSNGNLEIERKVKIQSPTKNSLIFKSEGTMTVHSGSDLQISPGATLCYQATPKETENLYNSKRHLIMESQSATITLKSCTLQSTSTALALDRGKVVVMGNSTFKATGSTDLNDNQDFELNKNLEIIVTQGSTIKIDGNVSYGKF